MTEVHIEPRISDNWSESSEGTMWRAADAEPQATWQCHYGSPYARYTIGNWRPTKYATKRFPVRVEDGVTIESLVEMYHGAPSPYDNRYACRVTDEQGRTAQITDCESQEVAERLALTFLKQKQK